LLAVTYDATSLQARRPQVVARESSLGASLLREQLFAHTGLITRVLAVPATSLAAAEASLRSQAGVKSVSLTGSLRSTFSVIAPYYTNDPYFNGFLNPTPPAVSTYHVPPYEESASVPGQWDMHAIGLGDAWEYSQTDNGSTIYNAAAIGKSTTKIAVIDTGADTLQPKLASKVVYQRCFITDTNNVQSTSDFSTDPQGHGTDVTGLAGDEINAGFGFVGAGGNSTLYSYRVFPTPDDNCTNSNSTDAQCDASSNDIISAIEDAVSQGVNVISLSFGGGGCTNGQDQDSFEGNAIADAIAANIIVVAAAGNVESSGGSTALSAPACDPGVIAVGASALADGQPNGSNFGSGSSAAPVEYIPTYSRYGSPAADVNSANAWGIVAPGGDSASVNDQDDLHWINNIWTSTPFDSKFAGSCGVDYPGTGTTVECQVFIDGTSMATPIVAGSAALIISANPSYQSPTRMKQLLCSTADDIAAAHEGCGRLDIYRAMATAVGDQSPPASSTSAAARSRT
jgi:subtilisin family serine protease